MQNMMKSLLLTIYCFLSFSFVKAQFTCGFDDKYQQLLRTDPNFAKTVAASNRQIQQLISNRHRPSMRTNAVLYTIPVVVHVMHTGGAVGTIYNPDDAQIMGAIDYLNQVYAGTWSGMIPQDGASAVTDIQIRFALAQRAPGCGSTNGIDRVDASSIANYAAYGIDASNTNGTPELTVKNFSRWDPSIYYNVWVVNKIDGKDGTSGQFVAGYAYYAGAPASLDGTVMLSTQMIAGSKVLPHEIGHALNVYHTFTGSSLNTQCPANTYNDCSQDGDMVCDTDPITNNVDGSGIYDFTCRTGSNTCTSPVVNYSVNTEQNFMAYTNCSNLFTEGQKDRMLAAMSMPSRASLVAPRNMALVPCGTAINFSQSSVTMQEDLTAPTTGCRRYRDYTYSMVIGAAPSATAFVTLALSGTATSGVDYDITTNGNFNTPSNTLSFAASSTAAQNFTVRVYDDANIESTETAVVDFTINNGGGDAAKGTTNPTLTVSITDNEPAIIAPFSGTVLVTGSGTAYINSAPFDATQQKQRQQFLYTATELKTLGLSAGSIKSLGLFIGAKNTTRPFSNLVIKLGNTTVTNLVQGYVYPQSGLTTVYSNASYTTVAGWNTFNFSPDFSWDGQSNVVVELCYDNGTTSGTAGKDNVATYTDGSASADGNLIYQSAIDCSGGFSTVNYFGSGRKPIVQVGIDITGTQIETAVTSAVLHEDIGSSEYFYSSANKKLMARVYSTSNTLGCVTTAVEEAGTTWLNFSGGKRSAKVFAITPTTNGSTTGYTVSLYFDNSELDGTNTANIRMAKTTASSIAGADGTNTITVAPTLTTLGSNITVFTASFTGFSHFFLVTNTVTLPIRLTKLHGNVTNSGDIVLQWETSFEKNNRGFEIEISGDGKEFNFVSNVGSMGDTESGHTYDYTHRQPGAGKHYYRLKQTDIDGTISYSNIISFTIDASSGIYLAPVPAQSYVKVYFNKPITDRVQMEVLNVSMQLLYRKIIATGTTIHSIPLQNIPPGIYIVRIITAGQTEVRRFIKE
jgi:hypothetical protein